MIINTGMRTDIPAFYSNWFFKRIEEGFVYSRNPYKKHLLYKYNLNPDIVDCLCFCTKNPKAMLKRLDEIADFNQFWFVTINPYGRDVEVNVPDYKKVIKHFKRLSDYLGSNTVSLRYDPIFIDSKYTLEYHFEKFEEITSALEGYTHDCTISFVDLYKKTMRNFPGVKEVTKVEQIEIGKKFVEIGDKYGLTIKTCFEGTLLQDYGVDCSGCMTQQVIEKAINKKLKVPKGKYKARQCKCLLGSDIGVYNTCGHGCKYCYANANMKLVKKNQKLHNPNSPLLIGEVKDGDDIKEVNELSYIDTQTKLF